MFIAPDLLRRNSPKTRPAAGRVLGETKVALRGYKH
jgi:hypothetical protein